MSISIGDNLTVTGDTSITGIVNTVTNQTSNLTLTDQHSIIACDATSGVITITLPASANSGHNQGRTYYIHKIDSSGNAITITAGGGSYTINDAETQTLSNQYDSITVYLHTTGTSAKWYII